MDEVPLLAVTEASKSFAGTRAVDGVSFTLRAGEVHALVGENGAGKSTLMNIIAGVVRADAGEIRLAGRPVAIDSPRRSQELGIGMVFQELSLVGSLSVAENIFANRAPARLGLVDRRRLHDGARTLLRQLGLDMDPALPVDALPTSARQLVEIAKALSLDARVLILDEPTSALDPDEVVALFAVLRRLRGQGIGIVYISHRMGEVFEIADRITVLRDGRVAGTWPVSAIEADRVVRAMVGRDLARPAARAAAGRAGPALIEVRGLACEPAFRDIDLAVGAGEIVGLAGLLGAGRRELGRVLAGILRPSAGSIRVGGAPVRFGGVRDAMRRGIAYVPDERKTDGLFLDMSVADNVIVTALDKFARFGLLDDRAADRAALRHAEALRIRTRGPRQAVGRLSGGNQQKVMLAKWLERGPRLFIIDEPTKGVDVGAKQEIHDLLRGLARQGAGFLVISSELGELLQLADRILVMREGRLVGEMPAAEATEEAIMGLAAGVGPGRPGDGHDGRLAG
ncbi:MAG: sugar ABC transporter ATP-binding protein [Rhodospirillaceae bacterium]|nr:sugar ABC transporter ATP-binding protein [Rhodospirillaceae bacterium]